MRTLDDAVEYAAEHLPEGWYVEIYVESGSAWIRLENDAGDGHDVDTSELSLADSVVKAVHIAVGVDQS